MIIKQEVTYYVQILEKDSEEWSNIGAMGLKLDYALESIRNKRETFSYSRFRLMKKTIIHEVVHDLELEKGRS